MANTFIVKAYKRNNKNQLEATKLLANVTAVYYDELDNNIVAVEIKGENTRNLFHKEDGYELIEVFVDPLKSVVGIFEPNNEDFK